MAAAAVLSVSGGALMIDRFIFGTQVLSAFGSGLVVLVGVAWAGAWLGTLFARTTGRSYHADEYGIAGGLCAVLILIATLAAIVAPASVVAR